MAKKKIGGVYVEVDPRVVGVTAHAVSRDAYTFGRGIVGAFESLDMRAHGADGPKGDNLLTYPEACALTHLAYTTPGIVLELGTYKGYSACLMGVARRAAGGSIVCTVDNGQIAGCLELAAQRFKLFGLKDYVVQVCCDTTDKQRILDAVAPIKLSIGLLFIDATHNDTAVKREWGLYRPHVVKGGAIAFHDYTRIASVRAIVDKLCGAVTVVDNLAIKHV